jgi:hypothetical protein
VTLRSAQKGSGEMARRCPTCGAIVKVVGMPDFIGDDRPVTMHYEAVCDELVRELASVSDSNLEFEAVSELEDLREKARRLVEMMEAKDVD